MIKDVSFKNFRGFKDLTLSDLRRITLISGKNNAGKSSVLEGVFLAMNYRAPDSFLALNAPRSLPVISSPTSLWAPLFHNLDMSREIEISMSFDGAPLAIRYSLDDALMPINITNVPGGDQGMSSPSVEQTHRLKFAFFLGDFSESGYFILSQAGMGIRLDPSEGDGRPSALLPPAHYIPVDRMPNNSNIAMMGKMVFEDRKAQIIDALNVIDSSISDIDTLTLAIGEPTQIYLKAGGQRLPLKLAGDGVDRFFSILLRIMANPKPGSIVLIDEFEKGFHYSVYDELWRVVLKAAREYQCQIIATTHSYDCIHSLSNIINVEEEGAQDDFCYIRLDRDEEGLIPHRYSGDLLDTAIEMNMEVR